MGQGHGKFILGCVIVLALGIALMVGVKNEYVFFATYVVLQFIVLASAWNILGGYAGYVNFGSSAFFALGAYTSLLVIKAFNAPWPRPAPATWTQPMRRWPRSSPVDGALATLVACSADSPAC